MIELSRSEEKRAMKLHKESIVVDTHCDTLMKITDPGDFYLRKLALNHADWQSDPKKGTSTCLNWHREE